MSVYVPRHNTYLHIYNTHTCTRYTLHSHEHTHTQIRIHHHASPRTPKIHIVAHIHTPHHIIIPAPFTTVTAVTARSIDPTGPQATSDLCFAVTFVYLLASR